MYSIVNDLFSEKHVGTINRITKHNHHPQTTLVTAGSIAESSQPLPSPQRPFAQVYSTRRFMELSPLILANIDGVLPVLDVRIDGDSTLVLRPTYYDDVHGFLKHKKRFSELEASFYFRQMMNIVNTAHRNGIVLRDLKLKKFVFTDPSRYIKEKGKKITYRQRRKERVGGKS